MKKLLKSITFILLIGFASSCTSNDEILQNDEAKLISKEKVINLSLDSKYNIKKDVYNEFIESLTFDEKGRFRGAIYTGINKTLNVKQQNEFWKNFGINFNNKGNLYAKADPHIFTGYKPKPRGCKKRNNWICVLYGDMVQ